MHIQNELKAIITCQKECHLMLLLLYNVIDSMSKIFEAERRNVSPINLQRDLFVWSLIVEPTVAQWDRNMTLPLPWIQSINNL